jgi:multidrug resistance efflux pump
MKFIAVGIVLTVAIVGVSLTIDFQSRSPADRPPPDNAPQLIYASGRIEGATAEIKLRPQLAGRITSIAVKEGQFVHVGEVLLALDDAEYVQDAAVAEAEFHLAEARLERLVHGAHAKQRAEAAALYRAKSAELERARLTWQRIQSLLPTKAVTQQEGDDQRTRVSGLTAEAEAAEDHLQWLESPARDDEVRMETARVAEARARWKLAQVQLDRTRLRSPLAGQVLKVGVEVGELAGPATAEPAVIVADTSRCRVRAFVEEMDARDVRVGMIARITAEGPHQQELRGRVARISPHMEEKSLWSDHATERLDSKTREVWIDLDDRTPVVGLRVDVVIETS